MTSSEVWIIDDDADRADHISSAVVRVAYPGAPIALGRVRVRRFSEITTAIEEHGTPVLVIVDISAVCPPNLRHTSYSSIAAFAEKHPGCVILIVCQVGIEEGREIAERVRQAVPDALVSAVHTPPSSRWKYIENDLWGPVGDALRQVARGGR